MEKGVLGRGKSLRQGKEMHDLLKSWPLSPVWPDSRLERDRRASLSRALDHRPNPKSYKELTKVSRWDTGLAGCIFQRDS